MPNTPERGSHVAGIDGEDNVAEQQLRNFVKQSVPHVLRDLGQKTEDYINEGIKEWRNIGLSDEEIIKWFTIGGIGYPKDVKELIVEGVTPEELSDARKNNKQLEGWSNANREKKYTARLNAKDLHGEIKNPTALTREARKIAREDDLADSFDVIQTLKEAKSLLEQYDDSLKRHDAELEWHRSMRRNPGDHALAGEAKSIWIKYITDKYSRMRKLVEEWKEE